MKNLEKIQIIFFIIIGLALLSDGILSLTGIWSSDGIIDYMQIGLGLLSFILIIFTVYKR